MSDAVAVALVCSVANGLITWGIVKTQMAWLRRDVDSVMARLDHLQGVKS